MHDWLRMIADHHSAYHSGHILRCEGLLLIASLPEANVGELCWVARADPRLPQIQAEVIAIAEYQVKLMPFQAVSGISFGNKVTGTGKSIALPLGEALLGHVLSAFGQSLEAKPLHCETVVTLQTESINPLHRKPITEKLHSGIKAIDSFIPFGKGQRMGILAGSGVGKSTLLGMFSASCARQASKIVMVLVGERGREVEEFVNHQLSDELRQRAVVIAATADEMPVTRVLAVKYGIAVAEMLSHAGHDVVLMIDSLTRLAMAQREIGLAIGEPPTTKGYTPSVFSLLQWVVERAGAFRGRGAISALFSILVESDDFDDPVVDSLRALLDGHIVLDRELAEFGHFPAIDILRSVSRLITKIFTEQELISAKQGRSVLAEYKQKKMLIELAAAEGSLSNDHRTLQNRYQELSLWLQQDQYVNSSFEECQNQLVKLLEG